MVEHKVNQTITAEGKRANPSDFMRARHPELFSDSVRVRPAAGDIRQLEFYLETLTQRKEETVFEHFCRRLAEKEICPNLIVQTGPTGGGDSKADTETYPVAVTVADRWYVGNPQRSGSERWAFAFSAQKQWRTKVRQDVQKIAQTERGYSLIYFIGNQAVRDKDRAAVEDELKKKWKVPVRILDRSWILDAVQKNDRWEVVYQTLDINRSTAILDKPGPLDAQRQAELDELERLVGDPTRYQGSEYQLVQDCLQTALLARSLGKPRTDVDGRFDRAERVALANQLERDRFLILYQRAWAAFWWFDDYDEMDRLYGEVEQYGLKSEWVWDAEKLVNLWHLSIGWNREKVLAEQKWSDRTAQLRATLLRFAGNSDKPTSALVARASLVLMDFVVTALSGDNLESLVGQLRAILKEAHGHLEFPMETFTQIMQEFGNIERISDALSEVIEDVIQLQRERNGESAEGRARLNRALQVLKLGKTYEAIKQSARAQILLAKEETFQDFLEALVIAGLAYESAGLLWAARGNIITALDRSLATYSKDGAISPQALMPLRKLIWLELQLGRPAWVQIWWEWIGSLRNIGQTNKIVEPSLDEELGLMDTVLGILVLRTSLVDLRSLDRVPELYDRLGLRASREALLFALGYGNVVCSELGVSVQEMDTTFHKWLTQPAAEDLPEQVEWFLSRKVSIRTVILGCQIELVAENNPTTVLLGESLLAFVESFFSTVIANKRHLALLPYLKVELRQSDFANSPFSIQESEDDCGEIAVVLAHGNTDLTTLIASLATDNVYRDFLFMLIKLMRIGFTEQSLKEVISEEGALDRAYLCARSLGALTSVVSISPKYDIDAWTDGVVTESFSLRRTTIWPETIRDTGAAPANKSAGLKYGEGKPPSELSGIDALRHKDFRVLSLINMRLWDRAKWKGLGFAVKPTEPPVWGLVLAFEDMEAGKKIFRGWHKRVGQVDTDELIDVTIILGTERKNPSHYRVAISLNMEALSASTLETNYFALLSRMQDMMPKDNTNIDRFIQEYRRTGRYFLAPGQINLNAGSGPYADELEIEKRRLKIVNAWEISENDPTRVVLGDHEDPVIPADISDPPIFQWLRKKRK